MTAEDIEWARHQPYEHGSDYISAGFIPQCGCSLEAGYGVVGRAIALKHDPPLLWNELTDDHTLIRYNRQTYNFEMNIGDVDVPMWVGTEYYWDNWNLLTRKRIINNK